MKNIILCISLFTQIIAYSQFGVEQLVTGGSNEPYMISLGDLDDDGDIDVVAAVCAHDKIIWYQNLGDGNFRAQAIISTEVDCGVEVHIADLNGDGRLDIVSTSLYDNKLAWYENLGDGEFGEQNVVFEDIVGLRNVHLSDLNNDGHIDVIITSSEADKIQWYENDGSGGFDLNSAIPTTSATPRNMATGDLDGDGDIDFVVSSWTDDRITWNENLGGGDFSDETLLISGSNKPEEIDLVDFDEDGDLDLLYAASLDNEVLWASNLGDGTFDTEVSVNDALSNVKEVRGTDVDLDGDIDIVGVSSAGEILWNENIGGGIFGASLEISDEDFGFVSMRFGDIDGDGIEDIVFCSWTEKNVYWRKNLGGGTYGDLVRLSHRSGGNRAIHVADIDGDGDKDILSAAEVDNAFAWHENLGDGIYNSPKSISTPSSPEPIDIGAADIDGDGDLDIVTATDLGGDIYWVENDGTGDFSIATLITVYAPFTKAISLDDLDGDGDIDVVVISSSADRVRWYANDGAGNFASGVDISTDVLEGQDVFTIDLDGDGDIDVLSASEGDDKIAWFENDGTGVFSSEIVLSTVAGEAQSVHAYDLDGDGDLDVISGSFDSNDVMFFENEGDATFAEGEVISFGNVYATSVFAADLDNDGDGDILTVYNILDRIGWYENLGDLTFSDVQIISTEIAESYVITADDMDQDGDMDVIAGAFQYSKISIFDNYNLSPDQARGVVFVDLNENGIKDDGEFAPELLRVITEPEAGYAFIYPDGKYFINFDGDVEEHYVVTLESIDDFDNWVITTDSVEYNVFVDDAFGHRDSLDFGIFIDTLIDEVSVDLTGGFHRCNRNVNYWINYRNTGTTSPSGIIHLTLDDSITFIGASIEPDSTVEQNVYWHYEDLGYFEARSILMEVQMPDFLSMGTLMESVVNVRIDSGDVTVYTAVDELNEELVCAYDPNDKIGTPAGIDSLGYIDNTVTEIIYTVRFQNTGTDTAFNVVVKDQLDANLDWSTLEFVSSSHSGLIIDMSYDGELTFTFDNIMLPDSNVNEPASHGFFKYKIDLNESLSVGTQIFNTANIYFDDNPAVITNTKINTIYDCSSILTSVSMLDEVCFGEVMLFNPETFPSNTSIEWTIEDSTIFEEGFEWLADSTGVFELSLNVTTDFCEADSIFTFEVMPDYSELILEVAEICESDSLVIFGEYQTTEGFYYDSLVTALGCDSILIQELVINPHLTAELATISICEGDSALIFDAYRTEAGFYNDTLTAITSCDSILTQQLIVNSHYMDEWEPVSICMGDSLLIFGEYRSAPDVYYDSLTSVTSCDSVLLQELIVYPLPIVVFDEIEETLICIESGNVTLGASPFGGLFSGIGVIGDEFDPNAAGEGMHTLYYDYEDDNSCTNTDSIQVNVVDCLGVSQNEKTEITVYPNPFYDFTTIYFGKELTENHTIVIYDILGKEVYRNENLTGQSLEIKKTDWGAGIYILALFNPDSEEILSTKLIVE